MRPQSRGLRQCLWLEMANASMCWMQCPRLGLQRAGIGAPAARLQMNRGREMGWPEDKAPLSEGHEMMQRPVQKGCVRQRASERARGEVQAGEGTGSPKRQSPVGAVLERRDRCRHRRLRTPVTFAVELNGRRTSSTPRPTSSLYRGPVRGAKYERRGEVQGIVV